MLQLYFKVRESGVELFGSIHELFSILHTGYQSETEKDEFDRLVGRIQKLWTRLNPSESVPLKLHSLTHIGENIRREGHGGREVELIEHIHHCMNVLYPKYLSVTPLSRRLSIVVNRLNSKRFLLF